MVRRSIFALLAGLLGLGSPLAAGEIWSSLDDGFWRIHSKSAPGSALRMQGLPPGGDFGAPSLSPDGSRIAIEMAGTGVAVCSQKTAACVQLEDVPGVAARPTWNSRTGDLVFALFQADAKSEDSDLWVVDSALENPRPLVVQTGNQDDPDVSPDGRFLAYSSGQTVRLHRTRFRVVRHLWIMDLVTGRAWPLVAGAFQDLHPDWSPDGQQIAFASNRSGQFEIWVISVEGGELRQVTSGGGSKTWPAWAPGGESLLFTQSGNGLYTLMEVGAAGSEPKPFTPVLPGTGIQMRDADWR